MNLIKPLKVILLLLTCFCLASQSLYAWQQQVDYSLSVKLDDRNHYLFGSEIITYHNNSPDTLSELYLHLYPNAFKDKNTVYAREAYAAGDDFFYYADKDDRGWIDILDVRSNVMRKYEINGTIMRMELSAPCLPDSHIVFGLTFYLKIPQIFSRLGHANNHYEFTQWYPKVCTYD
ncbi:MAG: hypothetical protein GF315_12020, partial [candidate division Zixibacteria bacterium]|nr:hypothetical protein [candidate division Zixibacteria bacterium]